MYNEEAISKYNKARTDIQAQIDKLQAYLADYDQVVKSIHWGHVGDMLHIAQHLAQITEGEEDE